MSPRRRNASSLAVPEAIQGEIRETILPNGIRVLTEAIPGVRSASVGVWIRQGAAHETAELAGSSHMLEHMVFKGTEKRTAREIALSLERLGGSLDAFTSREHTSFQARVLSEHLPVALEVLSDLVLDPLIREEDLTLEREVVLEEISTVEDTPDDLVFELHGESFWKGHPYGRSILGTRDTVGGMGAATLRTLHDERYREGPLVVAAAGFLDHQRFVDATEALFAGVAEGESPNVPPLPADGDGRAESVSRAGTQAHLVFGVRTPPRSDPARFPLVLISAAFGGGMGSRLFQRIREELGLAYTVYSFQSFYSRAGMAGVYLGTRPDWQERASEAVLGEYEKLARDGLEPTELREVKDQVKGQLMLSLESTGSRLYRLAGFALYDEPGLTLDELLATIEAVTSDEIAEVAGRYFRPERQVVLHMGPGAA
ncbi:MAG: insulinase family protein [Gemmatimonadetes bacterium]|nr:insulinase family protein [Gemmatimonadota bacterium]